MSIYTEILQKYWGYSGFRPLQEDIIKSVADQGRDTLGLLPTGGGKSIIFQVPALAKEGVCLVVTPLIALMKDQVDNLNKRNIKAAAIYSGLTPDEIQSAFDACAYGDCKFLYLSPERLATEYFIERIKSIKVSFLAIDEAHCISQWGYDFRPSYLKIAAIRDIIPDVPVLALTATATPEVADDIQDKLCFKEKNVFRKSFYRDNLVYIVRKVENKEEYLLRIVNSQKGSGVVYVRNRKHTREIAEYLQKHGISADYFHAGLSKEGKDFRQNAWKEGKIRIICATNAFGMGIDKPDVRFVVHLDIPDSLEAYFQEAGRGGRDEKRAYAVLLYNNNDISNLKRNLTNSYPDKDYIKNIYNALGNYFQIPIGSAKGRMFDFRIADFCERYELNVIQAMGALKILERNGYLELTEEVYTPSKLMFIVDRNDLYKFQVANAKFDSFIKLVLRAYTGLFSTFVNIDEFELAKYSKNSVETVRDYLGKLKSSGIVNYIPQKRTPYLIYSEERLDEKNIRILPQTYDLLKKLQKDRIEAVIAYCLNNYKCRSRQLTEYFGEKNENLHCGICDVCKENTQNGNEDSSFDKLFIKIGEMLSKGDISQDLLIQQSGFDKRDVMEAINKMIDSGIIKVFEDGTVTSDF